MITIKIHNDEPTLEDLISHAPHVRNVAHIITSCQPPYVIGIHGDWGSGKTSFLRKLHLYLSCDKNTYDDAENTCTSLWGEKYKEQASLISGIETIWFDAWHHQHDENPIVALLNEIRAHFTLSQKFVDKAEKLSYAALMSLDSIGKKIGISPEGIVKAGEKWEQQHFTQPLPSQLVRELLEDAIDKLIGKKSPDDNRRLVIFVDDLDRCLGPVAFKFLEAMKIYLSLSNCVFVLGMDVRHIRRAVAAELKSAGVIPAPDTKEEPDRSELYAADYLSKMFQHVFYLPNTISCKKYLTFLMGSHFDEKEAWIDAIIRYNLLPHNPRKIKSFISGLTFYIQEVTNEIDFYNSGRNDDEKIGLDRELTLIFAYLKLLANDIYRCWKQNRTSGKDWWISVRTASSTMVIGHLKG